MKSRASRPAGIGPAGLKEKSAYDLRLYYDRGRLNFASDVLAAHIGVVMKPPVLAVGCACIYAGDVAAEELAHAKALHPQPNAPFQGRQALKRFNEVAFRDPLGLGDVAGVPHGGEGCCVRHQDLTLVLLGEGGLCLAGKAPDQDAIIAKMHGIDALGMRVLLCRGAEEYRVFGLCHLRHGLAFRFSLLVCRSGIAIVERRFGGGRVLSRRILGAGRVIGLHGVLQGIGNTALPLGKRCSQEGKNARDALEARQITPATPGRSRECSRDGSEESLEYGCETVRRASWQQKARPKMPGWRGFQLEFQRASWSSLETLRLSEERVWNDGDGSG